MEETMAERIFSLLVSFGCRSVHIGGGEPLLRPDRLCAVLTAASKMGVGIEYVETNASWYRDEESASRILRQLRDHGVDTLLVSLDPFHNEFIPYRKTKGLMDACARAGMGVFPWRMEFAEDLEAFDDSRPHELAEYEERFGPRYRNDLLRRYGLNMRGRALESFRSLLRTLPTAAILAESASCTELDGIHHFHIDLYGNFVPQSCAGLSVAIDDLRSGADPAKYALIDALRSDGVRGLYEIAVARYAFAADAEYAGKCDLCQTIRKHIARATGPKALPDLRPAGHYANL
jgi:hypothetical protein